MSNYTIMGWRLAISLVFSGLLLILFLFSSGTYSDVLVAAVLAPLSLVPLLLPRRMKVYKRRKPDITGKVRGPLTLYGIYSQIFVRLEEFFPIFRRLRLYNEGIIERRVKASGAPHDPEVMATTSTRMSLTLVPIVICGGILGLLFVSPLVLVVMLAPPVAYFMPLAGLKMKTMERKSRIEEETAYFLSYVNIMQSVNAGLYSSFKALRGSGVFPAMERDANEIIKRVELLGHTQTDSLDIYAKTHPSKHFADFVTGYLAKIRSVGNVPAYTESKAKYFFDEYMGVWDRYEKSAQEIFGAIIMVAIILPMMIAFNAILGGSGTSSLMMLLGIVIPPMVSMMMVVMLNSSQPSTGNTHGFSPVSLAPGFVVGMSLLIAGIELPTSIAVSCTTCGLLNYSLTKKRSVDADAIDSTMPEFMRDVTEISKTGQNINQIIQMQATRESYKSQFNKILKDIALNIRTGMSFGAAISNIKTNSKQVKFIMFLLGRTYTTGGGTSEIFYNITEFISQIEQKKRQITKSLSSMTMIVFAAPFLMMGISHMMVSMFGDANQGAMEGIDNPFAGINEQMLETISLMAVTTSVSIGVVASKISAYTIKNTLSMSITSLTSVLAIHVMPIMMGLFL